MKTPENQCLEKAMRLLSRSSHSKRRLREKLSAAYDSTVVDNTMAQLEVLGFLREREECFIWLNHYLNSKKSKKEIFFFFLKRGFEKELISEVLDTVSDEREVEIAVQLLKKTGVTNSEEANGTEKAIEKLVRKGFSVQTVRLALKTFDIREIESDFYENSNSLS